MAYAYEITSIIYFLKPREVNTRKTRVKNETFEYTIIIPIRNEEHNILYSLGSALQQTLLPKKIIIAEDNSTDSTYEVVYNFLLKMNYSCYEYRTKIGSIDCTITKCQNDRAPMVEIIRPRTRLGKGRFINLLVETGYITTPYFLNLDADTVIEPKYVEKLFRNSRMAEDNGIAAVYGRLISIPERNILLARLLARGRSISYLLADIFLRYAGNIWNFHAYLRGPFVLFRTDVYRKIPRPLDNHSGDTAHAWELQRRGYKILIELSARGFTKDPPDIRGSLKQRIKWHGGFLENLYLRGYKVIRDTFRQNKKRGFAALYTLFYYGIFSFKYQLTWGFIIPILTLLSILGLSTTIIYYLADFTMFLSLSLLAKNLLREKYPDDPYSSRGLHEFIKDFFSFYFVFRPIVTLAFIYSYMVVLKDIVIAKLKREKPKWILYT